ncbi:hypothetical protein QR680_004273 [Steinernema hermaphroditum]|uniref:RING-type domain-containing protein n=1 Tax=Steinernema hermaphroditum TaxID=289476 RepID=A0AA39HN62_9BILA|nr:hypothetical protein QR680_004273 [Steinernema hermaphroditum]
MSLFTPSYHRRRAKRNLWIVAAIAMPSASCFFHCSHRRYDAPFTIYRNYAVFISNFKYLVAANLTTGQLHQLQIEESQRALLKPLSWFSMKQVYNLNDQLILVFARCEGCTLSRSPSTTWTAFYVPIDIGTLSRTFRFLGSPVSMDMKSDLFKMLPEAYVMKSRADQCEVYSIGEQIKIRFPAPPTTNPTPVVFLYNDKPHCLLHDFSAALVFEKERWNRREIQISRLRSPDMAKYASISLAVGPQGVLYIVCSSPRETSDDCEWMALDMSTMTLSPLKIEWSNHRLRQNCRITFSGNFLFLSGRCALAHCSGEAHLYAMELEENETPEETPPDSPASSKDMVFVTNNALACPVCYEVFIEPKQLPCCAKTLCHNCEERLLRDRKLCCPLCRQMISFQTETARLPPNRALKEILEQLSASESSGEGVQCFTCSDTLQPEKSFYCETCDGDLEQPLCGSCGLTHHLTNRDHVLTKTAFVSIEDRREMIADLSCSTNLRPMITSCSSLTIHTLKSLQTLIDTHCEQQSFLEEEFLQDAFVTQTVVSNQMSKLRNVHNRIRDACTLIKRWDERTRQGLTELESEISAVFNDDGTEQRQS